MPHTKLVTWGIIGGGDIARRVFNASQGSSVGAFKYVATRNPDTVPELQIVFTGAQIVVGVETLLAMPELDAVYIATPHPFHFETVIAALAAGKHVLCEKPLGVSSEQAKAMVRAAQTSECLLSEAYAYRFHPQLGKVEELIKSDAIGTPRIVRANFGFNMPCNPEHRLYSPDLGGGAILDLGGYPLSLCLFVEGLINKNQNHQPSLFAAGSLSQTGVDDISSALVKLESGLIGEISCSIALQQSCEMQILGTKGNLSITNIWSAGDANDQCSELRIHISGQEEETVPFARGANNVYAQEFDAISNDILAGRKEPQHPAVQNWNTLALAVLLEIWRRQVAV